MLVTEVLANLFLQSVVHWFFPMVFFFPSEFINFAHCVHFTKNYIYMVYFES